MRALAAEGGAQMFARAKLMLVGEGRAGKTTTLNSLMGRAFDPHEHSTYGASAEDMAVTVDSKDICEWEVRVRDWGA